MMIPLAHRVALSNAESLARFRSDACPLHKVDVDAEAPEVGLMGSAKASFLGCFKTMWLWNSDGPDKRSLSINGLRLPP